MRTGHRTGAARRLRERMTDAERRLWWHLRKGRCDGARFRRQHPVGRYVVDFACLEAGLVVEVDGSQHLDSSADLQRTRFLEARGFTVIRFWNHDVLMRTPLVLDAIQEALEARRECIGATAPPPSGPSGHLPP
jgi:very-short-patch-repair endonuclease